MIKSAAAILALVLSAPVASAEPPRVALVRVTDVFLQLPATTQANEELKAKREAINKDKRLTDYTTMHSELEIRRKQLTGAADKIDPEARKKLQREYAIKSQEANALRSDFETFHAEKSREINAEMVEGMKRRLQLIRETTEKIAIEGGFDWILDSSGNTNTGVPLVLYAKNRNDLTDQVIAALAAPPPPAEPPPAKADKPSKTAPVKNR